MSQPPEGGQVSVPSHQGVVKGVADLTTHLGWNQERSAGIRIRLREEAVGQVAVGGEGPKPGQAGHLQAAAVPSRQDRALVIAGLPGLWPTPPDRGWRAVLIPGL